MGVDKFFENHKNNGNIHGMYVIFFSVFGERLHFSFMDEFVSENFPVLCFST